MGEGRTNCGEYLKVPIDRLCRLAVYRSLVRLGYCLTFFSIRVAVRNIGIDYCTSGFAFFSNRIIVEFSGDTFWFHSVRMSRLFIAANLFRSFPFVDVALEKRKKCRSYNPGADSDDDCDPSSFAYAPVKTTLRPLVKHKE
eukprot:gene12993-biopygen9525